MSDLFHKDIPDEFIISVFHVMNKANWHKFQVLTKRPERVLELNNKLEWTANIWMGTSVESEEYVSRINLIRETSANIKFLSLEPLLGPLPDLNLKKIDWVIVGGESGFKARPMKPEWVLDIKAQCELSNTPFFFKQWGGKNKKKAGRLLEGRTWDNMPKLSRVA
jgi:protein gp37